MRDRSTVRLSVFFPQEVDVTDLHGDVDLSIGDLGEWPILTRCYYMPTRLSVALRLRGCGSASAASTVRISQGVLPGAVPTAQSMRASIAVGAVSGLVREATLATRCFRDADASI